MAGEEESSDPREGLWREAVWKWRWLGFRDGTPAFRWTLGMLGLAALGLLLLWGVVAGVWSP